MAVKTGDRPWKYKLLFACIMLSNISLNASVSLSLTELRNKISKLKVHPRGNLWATGHFMGKKSISDSQLQDHSISSASKGSNNEESGGETEDWRELVSQEVLKVALQAELLDRKRTQDGNQDTDFIMKLLKLYADKGNVTD